MVRFSLCRGVFVADFGFQGFNIPATMTTGIAIYPRKSTVAAIVPPLVMIGKVLSVFKPQVWKELWIPCKRWSSSATMDMI
jgi:hypothetical protein